ncbi:hypothetical protein JCGZ_23877 [Jatropha curcas]|uniref:Uncharacterized protein n=1 Tax=Jatropha curcas TaxID=180498 RepID=A0A067LEJ9_JATCU|nr:hypothetical protein JCGZ_23877 [Jatropha curcas]
MSSGNLNLFLQEEVTSLRAKVAMLEEELRKSRQEAADNHNLCCRLEKELKELKDYEQQMKPKRMKMISDLLISVSKAERQEARIKVRQDSLRLGNVGVIRTCKLTEMTPAAVRQLVETKEAVERQRKSLKKRQSERMELNGPFQTLEHELNAHSWICFNNFDSISLRLLIGTTF